MTNTDTQHAIPQLLPDSPDPASPVVILDIDSETADWLKLEAKRVGMPVEDLILEIVETRRLFTRC